MNRDDQQIPEALKRSLRTMLLNQLRDTRPSTSMNLSCSIGMFRRLKNCWANIREQIDAGAEDINDSGMVAMEYYLKRVRYSHVIYMTSLLETFLERPCESLTTVVGTQNLLFTTAELKGDQWSVKRKFLERYGKFQVPDTLWSEIQSLISLRNNLVHDNGSMSDLKPNAKNMLAKRPGVKLSGHEIVIEAEHVRSVFEAMKSLVRFVEARLSEAVDRAIRPRTIA